MNTLYRPLQIRELRAQIPVLTEVKEYLLVRHPPSISKNKRIKESKVVSLPRRAGGEGTRSVG